MLAIVFIYGYFRFISENDRAKYIKQLEKYKYWESGIPFAVSVFGEILVWSDDGFTVLYKLMTNTVEVLTEGTEYFKMYIKDEGVQKDYFEMDLFDETKKRKGELASDQVYTFNPAPILGGTMSVESTDIGDALTYISILIQFINEIDV